jgi:hypothetical protein
MSIVAVRGFSAAGNVDVQRTLFQYLDAHDPEVRVLSRRAARLERDTRGLEQERVRGHLGWGRVTEESELFAVNAIQTLRFLQLVCEGHNILFQNYLREQPKSSVQVDLIQHVSFFY